MMPHQLGFGDENYTAVWHREYIPGAAQIIFSMMPHKPGFGNEDCVFG
jgi:hypothetical protein